MCLRYHEDSLGFMAELSCQILIPVKFPSGLKYNNMMQLIHEVHPIFSMGIIVRVIRKKICI